MSSSIYELTKRISAGNPIDSDVSLFVEELFVPIINRYLSIINSKGLTCEDFKNILYEHLTKNTDEKQNKKKTALEKAIEYVEKFGPTPTATQDREIKAYICNVLKNRASKELKHNDPKVKLWKKIEAILKEFVNEGLLSEVLPGKNARYFLKNFPENSNPSQIIDDVYLNGINVSFEKGREKDLLLPSSSCLRKIIPKIFNLSEGSMSCSEINNLVRKYYNLFTDSIPIDEKGITALSSDNVAQNVNLSDMQIYAEEFIKIIESIDGVPIDPAVEGNRGKLGKLFVDYFLWSKLAYLKEKSPTRSGKSYGIKVYAQMTGFSFGHESERANELKQRLKEYIVKNELSGKEQKKMVEIWLRKFLHRKPKFIEDPYSYYD